MEMGAHAVVTLILTGLALAVTAGYLIHVARILWVVIDRLVIILGAVDAVTEKSAPMGPVVEDISRDLEQTARAMQACVQRLEERRTAREEEPAAVASARHSGSRGWWNR